MVGETSERTKRCSRCFVAKPMTEFSPANGRKTLGGEPAGFVGICKPCSASMSAIRRWRRAEAGPAPDKCEMCGEVSSTSLHVDHDHETGATRGFICRGCNMGLGHLKDTPRVLVAGLRYLATHGKALPTEDLVALLQSNTDRETACP